MADAAQYVAGEAGCIKKFQSPWPAQLAGRPGSKDEIDMTISAGPGSAGTAGAGATADMSVQRDPPVPADDGFVLRADVFRPSGSGPFR